MRFMPYLNFDGNAGEAMRFYQEIFGGDLELSPFGESPMADEVPADMKDRLMHAELRVGDQVLMSSDAMPGQYGTPAGTYVTIALGDVAEADRIFAALADGGVVQMPIQETFWAKRFGMLADRYGTLWMVNCE
ncbi:MAG TPA: VOC family protein [Longimicrobiales bacterium]|nr:VOC family protein [Longimicrobiales bacterium]